MSEPLDVAQWAKNWEALARQAQASFAGNSGQPAWATGQASGNPWADVPLKSPPFFGGKQQSEAMEHLMAGAQGYLGMLQSMTHAASGLGGGALGSFPGIGALGGAFAPSTMGNPFAAAMRGFGNQGARGFEQMMEQFSAAAGPMFEQLKSGLHLPAFGHLREKQENLQKAAQVFINYQEQSARYDRLMLKVGEQSFARFQLKLAEREEPGRQIDSVRGLYDLWIDAAEEAYAEIALSEEFREVYAAVVDAQMRVRQHVQGEIEKFCGELGMPTRSEVNSIGERLQAVRRELREAQEAREYHDELRSEVAALKEELATLKSAKASQEAPTPIKPVAAAKPAKPRKAPKAKAPEHAAVETEAKGAAKKPRRKAMSKAAPARRGKRRKSSTAKSVAADVAPARASGRKERNTGGPSSFAASIARFARKSKSSTTAGARDRAKPKAAKRGGSK